MSDTERNVQSLRILASTKACDAVRLLTEGWRATAQGSDQVAAGYFRDAEDKLKEALEYLWRADLYERCDEGKR